MTPRGAGASGCRDSHRAGLVVVHLGLGAKHDLAWVIQSASRTTVLASEDPVLAFQEAVREVLALVVKLRSVDRPAGLAGCCNSPLPAIPNSIN